MEMSKKKSLLIVDGQLIKIICGNKMKCISIGEVDSPKNVEFLNVLFDKTQVMKVDKVSRVSVEDILGHSALTQDDKMADEGGNFPRPVIASPAKKIPPPASGLEQWIKSNMSSIVLIDDLKIGSFHRDGIEVDQCLILEPGKPVNLASLDKDRLSLSRTLSRLMERGDVSRISYDEAMAMLEKFNSQTILSAHDDSSRGVSASTGSRARDLVDNMFSESSVQDIVVPIEDIERPDQDDVLINEGGGSMADLMSQIGNVPSSARNESFRGFRQATR